MSAIMSGFNEVWRYEGWKHASEAAYAGALDSNGNLILAGQQGLEATSGTDNTYLNILASDFAAVKLLGESGAVAWQWTNKFSGSSGDQVEGILGADTDSNNDVILGGFTTGFWSSPNENAQRNIAAVKLDGNTGDEIWRFQKVAEDSTSMLLTYYGSSSISGVAVDGYDNVFLVGGIYNSLVDGEGDPGDLDYVMVKLSGTTGTEIFTVQGGFSSYRDILHDAKVDSAGDVVAVGITGVEDQSDFFVVKLSGTNGSVLWEYSPPSTTIDVLHAVDFDDQDDVYVAGGEDTQNLQGGITDFSVVMKLSGTNGTVEWKYSGTTTSRTVFLSVAVDPTTGWVVGAGYTEGTWSSGEEGGANDFAAVVLDGETGEELTRFQNGTNGSDGINLAGFDSEGALFFGGYTYDMFGDQDLVGLKFSPFAEITPTPSPTKPPTSVITYASVMPTSAPFILTPTTPVSPTPVPVSPTPAPVSLTPALKPPTPGPVSLTAAPVSATPAPEPPTPAPKPSTPASDFPTSGPVSLTAILSSPTSTSEPQSPAPVFPTFTSEPSTPSRKLLTPDTISPTTAPVPTLVPTTTTAGGAAVLDKWKIGVISAGASLALIIFALCLYCYRTVHTQDKTKGAIKTRGAMLEIHDTAKHLPSPSPVTLSPAPPQHPPPAYRSPLPPPEEPESGAMLEINDTTEHLPSPSPVTISPAPPQHPPPAYRSPFPPPEEPESAVIMGAEESAPPYDDVLLADTHSPAPADKPWQRLADRKNHMPSDNSLSHKSYRDIPVRLHGPYAPAS